MMWSNPEYRANNKKNTEQKGSSQSSYYDDAHRSHQVNIKEEENKQSNSYSMPPRRDVNIEGIKEKAPGSKKAPDTSLPVQEDRDRYLADLKTFEGNIATVRLLSCANNEHDQTQSQQQVINLLRSAAESYQQALNALNNDGDPNRTQRAAFLSHQGKAGFYLAQAHQSQQPKEEVIKHLFNMFTLNQQAVAALDDFNNPNGVELAHYLSGKSVSLYYAAKEAQREQPNPKVINDLLDSANFHQQAVDVLNDFNNPKRVEDARSLSKQGAALFEAASKGPDRAHHNIG